MLQIFLMTWTIDRTNQFKKNFAHLPNHIQEKRKKAFLIFLEDPFHASLNTHKLQGDFSLYHSSSINYAYRFLTIIDFENKKITLINIGNHSIYK